MAGRSINQSVSDRDQLALFSAYHAEIEKHGANSPPAVRQRNRIVEFNKKLVYRPAKIMFEGTGEPQEDFEQVGWIGLIRAIELFDPTRGIRFSSYAMGFVRGEMRHHVRDNAINVNPNVSRTGQDLYYRVVKLHREALLTNPDADIDTIALTLEKPNGDLALTEYTWANLQISMTAGAIAELNEEIAGAAAEEEIKQLVLSGDFPTAVRRCLVEVVIQQPIEVPFADRVEIAAKKLRLTVAEVEERTKMGLNQIRALHELAALNQAGQT